MPSEGEDFYRAFRYHVVGPVGYRVSLWAELWRDGQLDALSPLTRGRWYVPPLGKGMDGYFEFKLVSGRKLGAAGKVRWEWNENWQPGGVRGGEWTTDPFAGLATSSTWDEKGRWTPSPGESCTLLILRGDEESNRQNKITLSLKMRFDPAKPVEQQEELTGGPLDVQSIGK